MQDGDKEVLEKQPRLNVTHNMSNIGSKTQGVVDDLLSLSDGEVGQCRFVTFEN